MAKISPAGPGRVTMPATTMGFWPFGRDPANIELVSRVITAATQNGYRVRGKLTIHFLAPQRQAEAVAQGAPSG